MRKGWDKLGKRLLTDTAKNRQLSRDEMYNLL
jgi:hypothetical protein